MLRKARDGDGDGFVYDGTIRMRPVGPYDRTPFNLLGPVRPVATGTERVPREPISARRINGNPDAVDGDTMPLVRRTAKGAVTADKSGALGAAWQFTQPMDITDKKTKKTETKWMLGFRGLHGNWPPGRNAPDKLEQLIEQMVGNLETIQQSIMDTDPSFVGRAKRWYDAANELARHWAGDTNHPDAISAVLAVLSPSMDWDNNIRIASGVISFHRENPRATEEVIEAAEQLADQLSRDKDGKLKKPEDRVTLVPIEPGQRMRDISDPTTRAVYMRAWDVQRNDGQPMTLRVELDADGRIVAKRTQDGSLDTMKTRYQSSENIAKALAILDDPSPANVNLQLGTGIKVRSFYNNIAYPNDPANDATMDTHAMSAAAGVPYAANSRPFKDVTERSTAIEGQLVKQLFVEAYRRLAEAHPDLYEYPRQAQSVLWEWWRTRAERNDAESEAFKTRIADALLAADRAKNQAERDERLAIAQAILAEWMRWTPPPTKGQSGQSA